MRRFNWKLLIVIFLGLAVLAATAICLRYWQKSHMAGDYLACANKAYEMEQWEQAALNFSKYIAVVGIVDKPILTKYADAQLNIRPLKRDNIREAVLTYRSILQKQPENYEVSKKLIQLYLEMGMYGESELIARRLVKNVHDPNIQRMLAVSLVGQRKFKDAAAQLNEIINADPGDIPSYEAISRLCEQRPEQFGKDAQFWLNEAVRQNPSSAMAYIIRAAFEYRMGNKNEAAEDFERAQKLDLSEFDVRLRLARELINAGKLSDARQHLEVLQSKQPKNMELWQTWAVLASKAGVKTQMIKVANDGLAALAPSNLDFMPAAAELLINAGDNKAAAGLIEILSQKDFATANVEFLEGMMAEQNAEQQDALKHYRRALEIDRKNFRVRMKLAELLADLGDERSAISQMRLLISEQPDFEHARLYLATLLLRTGRIDEAAQETMDLLQNSPDNTEAQKIYAQAQIQLFLRQKNVEDAIKILDRLQSADPNNSMLDFYRAAIEMRRNNFIEAQKFLSAAKTRQPDSPAVLAALVELNIRQNNKAQALELCDEAIRKNCTAQAYILRAHTYDLLGRAQDAQRDFERAAAIEPENCDILAATAEFYSNHGQSKKAADAWAKCGDTVLDDPQLREQALTFFLNSNDKEMNFRGGRILEESLASNPDDPRLKIWQARTLLLTGNAAAVDEAIEMLTSVVADYPKEVEAWNLLSRAWLRENEPAKALDAVLQGLVFLPQNRTLLLLKAEAEAAHTPELAVGTVKLLHEKDPNDTDVAVYLAKLYMQIGNHNAAISVLNDQLSIADPNARRKVNVARAVALHKNGDISQADKLFASLIKEDPNDALVMFAIAGLLKDEHKWDEFVDYVVTWYKNHKDSAKAVASISKDPSIGQSIASKRAVEQILRRALAVDQNSPELLNELAELLYLSGRLSEAKDLYQRLVELEPDNLTAINNLAWIMCEHMGKHAQALELVQKGLSLSPDYPDLIDTRGIAYFRLGKLDNSIADFTMCAKLYPDHVPSAVASYFHLGRAFAASARKKEAVKYLKMALDSNQKIGGLSAKDVAEAHNLLDGLLKG